MIIPGCAGAGPAREQRLVGVEDGLIEAGCEALEHVAFGRGWIIEKRQDLVAMTGENDVIEVARAAPVKVDRYFIGLPRDGSNAGVEKYVAIRCSERRDVVVTAAAQHAPLGMSVDAEHSVIIEE